MRQVTDQTMSVLRRAIITLLPLPEKAPEEPAQDVPGAGDPISLCHSQP